MACPFVAWSVLAIGRDDADVAPIGGVIFASGAQRIEVAVQVLPVGYTAACVRCGMVS